MRTINVVAAIIKKDGKILATQRGYGAYKDWWEFPGGKIEAGESIEAALVREIREELNADIKVVDELCSVEYDYPEFHLSMRCFMCELLSDDIVLLEHESAKWLATDELETVKWLPADIEVIQKLKIMKEDLRNEN